MEFTKAHGTGNDFVVLDDRDDALDPSPALVRALCDRRMGVGGDGILRIGSARDGADVFMDYRNADGSVVEMCGNGVRVVAKYVLDRGIVAGDTVTIATRSGVRLVEVARGDDGLVALATVDMGPPTWAPADVPFDADGDAAVEVTVDVDGDDVVLTAVSMGNPHAVLRVADVDAAPVTTLGPRIETHARFPKRTNVEFVQTLGRDAVRLRVWERGVGETMACGTGACATVVALGRLGEADDEVDVHVPGGVLRVRYRPDEHPSVFLTGPAVEVANGALDPAWLAAAARDGELT